MMVTYIFDTKVVDDEAEEDRAPVVAPQIRICGLLVVSMLG